MKLLGILIGIALTIAAYSYRASVLRQEDLDRRVTNIERFLTAVTQGQAAAAVGQAASR